MKKNFDISELDKIWDELSNESGSASSDGYLIRRIFPETTPDLFLGVEKQFKTRVFILKVVKSGIQHLKNLPESKGIAVKVINLLQANDNKVSIVIILKDEKFSDIFSSLVLDISEKLVKAKTEDEAVLVLVNRLKKWQLFFEQNKSEGLSEETVRGLFGELYFLNSFLIPKLNNKSIISWKGFQSTNQDYYFPEAVIEVKTTISREPSTIRIASERQLDKSGYPNLFIAHYSLDNSGDTGTTLPDLIKEVKNQLKGDIDLENYLETALFEVGYIRSHEEKYSVKFTVRSLAFYEVTDAFPKITEVSLQNGIGDVQYGISIPECRHFGIDDTKVLEILKGNNNG